eukprot:5851422-Amphidinium_carterae.2
MFLHYQEQAATVDLKSLGYGHNYVPPVNGENGHTTRQRTSMVRKVEKSRFEEGCCGGNGKRHLSKGDVTQGPLFPLPSLMQHGVIWSRVDLAKDLWDGQLEVFRKEVLTFFLSGCTLQELGAKRTKLT